MSEIKVFQHKDNYLYKFRSANIQSITMVSENSFWASKPSELNDPFEISGLGYIDPDRNSSFINDPIPNLSKNEKLELREKLKEYSEIGIYSLSKIHHSLLLWSHYADSSKGFCIIYDKQKLKNSFDNIKSFDVSYIEPECDLSKLITFPYPSEAIYGNKPFEWKYEKEHRLLFKQSKICNYDPEALVGIIFGSRCDHSVMDLIINQLKDRNIEFYKQVNSSFSFDYWIVSLEAYKKWWTN